MNYRENTHPAAAYSSTHKDRTGSFLGIPSIPVHTRTGDFQVTVCHEYFSVCFSDNEINTVLITSEFLL